MDAPIRDRPRLGEKIAAFWSRCVEGKRGRPLLLPRVNVCLLKEPKTAADQVALDLAEGKRARRALRNLSLRGSYDES